MVVEDTESRHLTIEECQLLADSLSDDAATLPDGPKKEELLKLAEAYRRLAKMKALVARKANSIGQRHRFTQPPRRAARQ